MAIKLKLCVNSFMLESDHANSFNQNLFKIRCLSISHVVVEHLA